MSVKSHKCPATDDGERSRFFAILASGINDVTGCDLARDHADRGGRSQRRAIGARERVTVPLHLARHVRTR